MAGAEDSREMAVHLGALPAVFTLIAFSRSMAVADSLEILKGTDPIGGNSHCSAQWEQL